MKKLLLSAFLLLSVVAVKAQWGGGGQRQMVPPAERATAMLSSERMASFAFTNDQKAKITPLLTQFYTSSDSLMATMPQDGDRMEAFRSIMPKREALSAPVEAKIVGLLTAEQKKAYTTALDAMKERNPNASAVFTGGFGGGRPRN